MHSNVAPSGSLVANVSCSRPSPDAGGAVRIVATGPTVSIVKDRVAGVASAFPERIARTENV